jgi:hypothetical protein
LAGKINLISPKKLGPTNFSEKLERKTCLGEAWRGRWSVPGRRWAEGRVQRAGQQCSGTVGTPCSFRPVTIYIRSVEKTATNGHRIRIFWGLLDPDPLVKGTVRIRIHLSSSKNSEKNLDS